MTEDNRISERLDWDRMLGFEQMTDARTAIREESSARLTAKVGTKAGAKIGEKVGQKIGQKIGAKVGVKS
jgi:hypothetical protein